MYLEFQENGESTSKLSSVRDKLIVMSEIHVYYLQFPRINISTTICSTYLVKLFLLKTGYSKNAKSFHFVLFIFNEKKTSLTNNHFHWPTYFDFNTSIGKFNENLLSGNKRSLQFGYVF